MFISCSVYYKVQLLITVVCLIVSTINYVQIVLLSWSMIAGILNLATKANRFVQLWLRTMVQFQNFNRLQKTETH